MSGQDCKRMLEEIAPHLILKAEQARLLMTMTNESGLTHKKLVSELNQKGPTVTPEAGWFARHVGGKWLTPQRDLMSSCGWAEFSESWPRSGMTRSGTAFRLPTLAPLTGETESGSLPTPSAINYGSNQGGRAGRVGPVRPSLNTMARKNLWPTPRAEDSEQTGGHRGKADTLTSRARMLPTPLSAPTSAASHGQVSGRFRQAMAKALQTWPTPQSYSKGNSAHPGTSLTDAVRGDGGTGRLWPTPAARDHRHPNTKPYSERGGGKKGEQLNNAVMHRFPTPTTPGPHQVGTIAEWGGRNNPLRTEETMTLQGGALNPAWVELLMGFPSGWTDLT